jgi:hypothetical protein
VLCHEPFEQTFFYGESLTNPVRVPHGHLNIRVAAALNRLNDQRAIDVCVDQLGPEFQQRVWTRETITGYLLEIFLTLDNEPMHYGEEVRLFYEEDIVATIDMIRGLQNANDLERQRAVDAR